MHSKFCQDRISARPVFATLDNSLNRKRFRRRWPSVDSDGAWWPSLERVRRVGVGGRGADQVLTTEHAGTPFTVVSPLRRLPSGRTLYKMFSLRPLHHRLLDAMFHNHTKVAPEPRPPARA